jgi:hypothetical protein
MASTHGQVTRFTQSRPQAISCFKGSFEEVREAFDVVRTRQAGWASSCMLFR